MIYLVTALDAEAKVLYDHFRLKRIYTLPYPVYASDEYILIVCGIGKFNAAMALSALLGYRPPKPNDRLINVGICAAPEEYEIGEALLIHQIHDQTHRYYPDILYSHPFKEAPCICVDVPASIIHSHPVDMESGGIFAAAERFFKLHHIVFVKIVSDHFEPQSVTKALVHSLISNQLHSIEQLIQSLAVLDSTPLFTSEEAHRIEQLKSLFTHSQQAKLEDALCYFRLRFPGKQLPIEYTETPVSKHERNRLHEQFIHTLVS